MFEHARPIRQASPISLTYGAAYSVLETINDSQDYSFAVAPHTVHLMNCGFMAINKYCTAKAKLLNDSTPRNMFDHKIINLPDHPGFMDSLEIIRKLLLLRELDSCYEIHVMNPFDLNENFAIIPVLVAILKAIDPEVSNDQRNRILLDFCLQDKEIPCKEAILEATLRGSRQMVHFPKITEPYFQCRVADFNSPSAPVEAFRNKYDAVFVRTNRHPSHFCAHLTPNGRNSSELIGRFKDELDPNDESYKEILDNWDVANEITAFSMSRIDTSESSQIEKDCSAALGRMEIGVDVCGFEVQEGGCIVLLKKGEFAEQRVLRRIANAIASQTEVALSKITFHLLKLAQGAEQLTEQDAIHLETQEWADVVF